MTIYVGANRKRILEEAKRQINARKERELLADIYAAELAALEPPEAPSDEMSPPPESQDS